MSRKSLTLLRILLIAIMVIQPAVSAYAMAAMSHSPNSTPSQAMPDHKMGHGAAHQATDEETSSVSMENCCASNATCSMMSCNVALLQNITLAVTSETTSVVLAYQVAWVGISLPTEIKPPRNTLS